MAFRHPLHPFVSSEIETLAPVAAPASRPSIPLGTNGVWIGLALILLAAPAPAQAPGLDDARMSLVLAKQAAADAEARAAALNQAAEDADSEAARARAKAQALQLQVQAAQSDIAAAQARIRLIVSLQQIARQKIADKQGPIMHLTAALQTMARRPPALAIAQPGSVTDIVHVRLLLADTLPVIQARTAGLRADLDKQTQLRSDAERAVAALDASRGLLAQRQQQLAALEQTAIRRSQRLAEQAADEQQRALGLGEEARDAADRMQSAEDAGDVRARLDRLAGPDMRQAGAGDAMPARDGAPRYRLPVTGTVETGYGEVSPAGVRSRGLTVATQPGADVVAPAAGTIVFAKPFRSYGSVVIIDHGSGWTTTLTGLARIAVKPGQRVAQGETIGSGGGDSDARVTAELRRGARPIDIVAMAQAG